MIAFNLSNHDVIVLYGFLNDNLRDQKLITPEEKKIFEAMKDDIERVFQSTLDYVNPDKLFEASPTTMKNFEKYFEQQQEKIKKILEAEKTKENKDIQEFDKYPDLFTD